MNLTTLNTEISNYYSTVTKHQPSKSAFSQQRSKLAEDALPNLLTATNRIFPFEKTFKGLHLLAADGTALNIPSLPDDPKTFMPYSSGKGGFHQDHLTAIYDLLENRYLDAVIVPRREYNENRDLCEMVDRLLLDEPCLFIADRAFCTFNTIAHVIVAGQYYLFRVKEPSSKGSFFKGIPFPNADEFSIRHTFILQRNYVRQDQDHRVYKRLHGDRAFDFLPFEDRINKFEIQCRLIKVAIGNNQYEHLITNLPDEQFPISVLKQLYNARWGIETSFRKLKYNLALTYFHSYKREFINQEIFSRIIMFNVISMIISSIRVVKKNTKYVYVISFSDAVFHCRRFLLTRMSAVKLKNLLLMSLSPIRPGRSSPRHTATQRLKPLNNRF